MLTLGLGLSAFFVGLAGVWSPCGLSIVSTLGGMRGRSTAVILLAGAAYVAGLAVSATAVYTGLALLGAWLDPGRGVVVGVATATLGAVALDLLGAKVRPQIPCQVPEAWRRTKPVPVALLGYGMLVGSGLATYVMAAAAWGLLALAAAAGSLTTSLTVAGALTVGRALPVLALSPFDRKGPAQDVVALPGRSPGAWRATRVLAALPLAAVVAAVLTGSSLAASIVAVSTAYDPSTSGTAVAWAGTGGAGSLRENGRVQRLPGTAPAVGGSMLAWLADGTVTVALRQPLQPIVSEPVPGAVEVAVSDGWLVVRQVDPQGLTRLLAQPLLHVGAFRVIASADRPDQLGRPALDGHLLVYGIARSTFHAIEAVDLETGVRKALRESSSDLLLSPSLHAGRLLYVDIARCSQSLVLGAARGQAGRAILRLPAPAPQDIGRDPGVPEVGTRTPCPDGTPTTPATLWSTALGETAAYAAVLQPGDGTLPRAVLWRVPLAG